MNTPNRGSSPEHFDILGLFESGFTSVINDSLRSIAEIAEQADNRVYLVGGAVRDLLLRETVRDIDIVVEGDALHLARKFAAQIGADCQVHLEFGTAEVAMDDGVRFDFATARRERYPATGALPLVQSSSIGEDLERRDFTLNTLAVELSDFSQLKITDQFSGLRDLRKRNIRVLHARSFWDDPTRILRAVRLEQRLGFSMEHETMRLAQRAIQDGVLEEVSGDRLRKEIVLLCSEPGSIVNSIERLDRLGLIESLVPGFLLSEEVKRLLKKVEAIVKRMSAVPNGIEIRLWIAVLLALGSELGESGLAGLADRFAIAGRNRVAFLDCGRRIRESLAAFESCKASERKLAAHQASRLLEALSLEQLVLLAAVGGDTVENWVLREIAEFRQLRLSIGGSELIERGFAAGPELGKALRATRDARLDGLISADGELEFANAWLSRHSEGQTN